MEKDLYKDLTKIKNKPFILLESAKKGKDQKTFLFDRFEEVISFKQGDNISEFFNKIEKYLNKGYWIAGYFAYEFGYCFEPELFDPGNSKQPLAWIGICKNPKIHKGQNIKHLQENEFPYEIRNIYPNISEGEYSNNIKEIKEHLKEGDTYQVNHTFKMNFDFKGDALGLYLDLRDAQPTPYLGLINTGKEQILSFSPELFFKINKGKITSKPMKGTLSRGFTTEQEIEEIKEFKKDKKIQAENVMIVDLLRNDIGRISKKVKTESLFDVEKHNTLYQMTSTISGTLKNETSIHDIFAALFPCGSVTGAPKIRTMQIIQNIEKEPRGVYTGAIGYISPQRKMCFNVAIRTAVIKDGKGELGVGGGIVYDSDANSEYKEALLKAKFLMQKDISFSLIETIKWDKDSGYIFLEEHFKRLQNSCQYFSIPININELKRSLIEKERRFKEDTRIRILVSKKENITIETQPMVSMASSRRVKISSKKVNKDNIFLYHKTTNRSLYDQELQKAKQDGFFEVIFLNQNNEITEGSFTNIFIKTGGQLFTPPIKSGLLNGVYRQHLLQEGIAQERVMTIDDLKIADKIYLANSVRGLIEAEFANRHKQNHTAGVEKALSL